LLLTLFETASTLAAGALIEAGVSLGRGFLIFGLIQIVCGLAWLRLVVPRERRAPVLTGG
jgi:hypothetical protein